MLVREAELCTHRDGSEYLKVLMGDRTGTVPALVWDEVALAREVCRSGEVVFVSGRYAMHPRFGPQLAVNSVRAAVDGEFEPDELFDGPPRAPEHMESDLRELIATVQNRHLRRLLSVVFAERSAIWASYREAPAAKRYHQAYRHGLLEHSLTVAQAVGALAATFPGIDRDVAVTGAGSQAGMVDGLLGLMLRGQANGSHEHKVS